LPPTSKQTTASFTSSIR